MAASENLHYQVCHILYLHLNADERNILYILNISAARNTKWQSFHYVYYFVIFIYFVLNMNIKILNIFFKNLENIKDFY